MKKILLLLIIILSNLGLGKFNIIAAQRIRGAEMHKFIIENYARVDVVIYRETASKEQILFDWGDGTLDTFSLSYTHLHHSGYYRDVYVKDHLYDTIGFFELGFRDSFLIEDIKNIELSGDKPIELKDTIRLFPSEHPFSFNYCPEFILTQFTLTNVIDGVFFSEMGYLQDIQMNIEDRQEELIPFPALGYSFPETTSIFEMQDNVLVWDRPIEPGTYGVCIKVREVRPDYYNLEDTLLMSTTNRAFVIDVDSMDIVSNVEVLFNDIVDIFPNPTKSNLHIQLEPFEQPIKLEIYDTNGKAVYHDQINNAGSVSQKTINVEDWPAGLYILKMATDHHQMTRKIVVHH